MDLKVSEVMTVATVRNVNRVIHGAPAFTPALVAGFAKEIDEALLEIESKVELGALNSFTGGCVSAISMSNPVDHDYAAALRNYGEVYEGYQAYLSPQDGLPEHDYDQAIAMSMPENSHFGCLNDDMVEYVAAVDNITDDEIESCGYLGWLKG